MKQNEVELLIAALPPLRDRGDESRLASLPLCVLDTVYNLGATSTSVDKLIARYCERYGLPRAVRRRGAPERAADVAAPKRDPPLRGGAADGPRARRPRDQRAPGHAW